LTSLEAYSIAYWLASLKDLSWRVASFDSTRMLACVELMAFRRLVLEMREACSIMPTSTIWEPIIQLSPSLK